MKRSWLVRLMFLTITATQLSGCIIDPWWHDRGRHEGEYRHEHHRGHDEGHDGHGDHH